MNIEECKQISILDVANRLGISFKQVYDKAVYWIYSYVAKFKRKDETVFTKRFLASDLFEAVEHALEYATKRDILYLDLGHAG